MSQIKNTPPPWFKTKFFRDIATLVSGTAVAQIAGLMFIPWITRLYGPEAFGGLGYFSSLLGFLTPLAVLCYPLALVLPKRATEAQLLFDLSLKIAMGASLLIAAILFVIDRVHSALVPFLGSYVIVPLGVFLSTLVMAYTQWAIRCGRYRLIAAVTVLAAVLGGTAKVLLGYFFPSAISLIVVATVVLLLNVIVLSKNLAKSIKPMEMLSIRARHWAVAKRYRRFPVYRMPHALMAIVSQIAPVFLLTSFFGAKYAGYFVLTRTVLSAPVTLIGKAVYDAAYPRISQRYNDGTKSFGFILKLTCGLVLISFLPLLTVAVAGDEIFSLVFGAEWERAGVYAAWMALWFAFNFSNKAIAAAISVYDMDGLLFRNGVVNMLFTLLGFLVGALYYSSDVASVALFSMFGVFCQCFLMARVCQRVRKAESNKSFVQECKK